MQLNPVPKPVSMGLGFCLLITGICCVYIGQNFLRGTPLTISK